LKFIVGLFMGLGLGIVIGLLIAPRSGEASNHELRARASEALAQGRELYSHTKSELTDRYTSARSGTL